GVKKITGKDIKFEQVDCCDKKAFGEVFKKYKFNSVIHFAAFKAVGESVGEPLKYFHNNLFSLITLLELMKENGVKNIV
ncbi:MAG: GDP-mannose 4,6-dehydratase, partial [Rikenellaceae bacterium]